LLQRLIDRKELETADCSQCQSDSLAMALAEAGKDQVDLLQSLIHDNK
jgi:hypothetical protein